MSLTKLKKKQKRHLLIAAGVLCITAVIIVTLYTGNTKHLKHDTPEIVNNEGADAFEIEVTAEEIQTYRENIGNSMDIKKSILIIFNDRAECQAFISEHGMDDNVLSLGKGILPEMQGDNKKGEYFNAVGNSVFECLFDNMTDGEYIKEPIEFGGAFCYFKRLESYSVVNNEEDLTEFIRQEKSMEKGGEINEENN